MTKFPIDGTGRLASEREHPTAVLPASVVSGRSDTNKTLPLVALPGVPWAMNVKDFGAVGDGTTDDTTAIQNAINAAQPSGGPGIAPTTGRFVVYFPSGQYKFSMLRVSQGVTLQGDGWHNTGSGYGGTVLISTATTGQAILVCNHPGFDSTISGFQMRDIAVQGPGSGTAVGVMLGDPSLANQSIVRSGMTNVYVIGFGKGINLVWCEECSFRDLHILQCPTGLQLDANTNNNVFVMTDVQFSTTAGVVVGGGSDGNTFVGGLLQNCASGLGIHVVSGHSNRFVGWWAEANSTTYMIQHDGGLHCAFEQFRADSPNNNILLNGPATLRDIYYGGSQSNQVHAYASGIILENVEGVIDYTWPPVMIRCGDPNVSDIGLTAMFNLPTKITAAGTTNLTPYDDVVLADATLGNQILNVPWNSTNGVHPVTRHRVTKTDASANTVTIKANFGDASTINGASTYVLTTQNQHVDFVNPKFGSPAAYQTIDT